jgi:hypothetical protein
MTLSLKSLTSRLNEWLRFRQEPAQNTKLEERLIRLELEVAQMKYDRSQVSESILPRTPGQDRGQVWISDDFNAPLPEPILNDFLNPS